MDSVTVAFATTLTDPASNKTHPGFLYIRTDSLDNYTGSHNNCDADSVCWVSAIDNNSEIMLTPKGIKRFEGENIIIGEYLDKQDTLYIMWVIADPKRLVFTTGLYDGDGSSPQTITHGESDTLKAGIVFSSYNFAGLGGTSFFTHNNGTFRTQYFGERGADLSNFTATTFDASPNMQLVGPQYGWFAVKNDGDTTFYRLFHKTGDAALSSNDTLLYGTPASFRSLIVIGSAFIGGSTTSLVYGSNAMGVDSSWTISATVGSRLDGSSGDIKEDKPDTLFTKGGGWLDTNTLPIGILAIGDTTTLATLSAPDPETDTRRDPCSGNISIENKGNISIDEGYR
jgi:hypothetical protein